MPDQSSQIPETRMSAEERRLRSQLARLVSSFGLLHATLNPRERICGKPNCRCAQGGEKHRSLYLMIQHGGRTRQLFIPRALEPEARQWVAEYQRLRRLLDELSEIYWEKLRRREL
jgi:hypothetical protein